MTTTERPTTAPASLFSLGQEAMALQAHIAELAEQLDGDDGPAAIEALEALLLAEEGNRDALKAKADAYCWVISQLQGQAAYRRAEADRLRDLALEDADRAAVLQDRLLAVLQKVDPEATAWSLPAHEIRSRRTSSVLITEEADLPPELLKVREVRSPDKAAIKEALKAGREVPGAELVEARSWSIR